MSKSNINDIPGLVAGEDLSSHQYKVVKFASTAGRYGFTSGREHTTTEFLSP